MADRLTRARKVAGIERKRMADILGVTPQSVSNYESGKSPLGKLQVNAWAVATEVDVEWLKTGKAQDEDPRGGNTQPSDYKSSLSVLKTRASVARRPEPLTARAA